MGFAIRRLLVDWPPSVAAHRSRPDFFWWARNLAEESERVPFVVDYDGPLSLLPGKRVFIAAEIYEASRPFLSEADRALCDPCFAALFWSPEGGVGCDRNDLERETGMPGEDYFSSMSPSSVVEVLGMIRKLPAAALEAAYERAGSPGDDYLPDFETFFTNHVGNHRTWLEAAARGWGTVSLWG